MPTNSTDVVREAREMANDFRYDIQPAARETIRALCERLREKLDDPCSPVRPAGSQRRCCRCRAVPAKNQYHHPGI